MLADDTKVFSKIKTHIEREVLQSDLSRLEDWSRKWQLCFNADKCKVLHIGRDNEHYEYYVTTLFRTGRDRSRPVRAQLPVSTRGKLERSFRILETTSRHGTSGRDRSRSVAPCQIYRVDARVGATDLSANHPLLAHAFLI